MPLGLRLNRNNPLTPNYLIKYRKSELNIKIRISLLFHYQFVILVENMPIFGGGKKTIWKIKELTRYERKLDGSEIPPIYDLEKIDAVHQEIDANIRPYWENLHPLVQDYVTSWNNSWNKLLRESQDLDSQLRQKTNLIANLKANFEAKLRELNSTISVLQSDLKAKEDELLQKEQLIQDLESMDKENKNGIAQLREKLEDRLKELNEKMNERQKHYESTQLQVGQAFQQKVLELDSEITSLQDQLTEKDAKIKLQEAQIDTFKKEIQKVKFYESKIQTLEGKLNQIVEILDIETEEKSELES